MGRQNNVSDLAEVLNLRGLRSLRVLCLSDNPCASFPHYRQYVIHHLPNLTKLDEHEVTSDEKRQAADADMRFVPTHVDDGGDFSGGHPPNSERSGTVEASGNEREPPP